MAALGSSLGVNSGINVLSTVEPFLPNIPPASLELEVLGFVESQVPPCGMGYMWNDEIEECVPRINVRSKQCAYGYKKYTRLDECRRVKYNVASQEKGSFRKFWDKHMSIKSKESATEKAPTTQKTTAYTDGWYGYRYDFGKDDPHW